MISFLGALLCCFLWGSAFPCIKIGYGLWDINSDETWKVICFAGVRFFLAGAFVILFACISKKKLIVPRKDEWGKILLLSLFQTIGQYVFFYIGLAHTTGVNSAVVDSLTTFFAIIIASLVMKMERLDFRKILGCVLGFGGVVIVNLTPQGFTFSLLGDGLVALSAMCYGVSSAMIKRYSDKHDTVLFSGYQFLLGGTAMTLIGALMGGIGGEIGSPQVTAPAVMMLVYLALVSSVAYTLWGILLKKNDVSKISIFGFMNPVIGVILSALLLGEAGQLGIKYVISLVLIALGIVVVNYEKNEKKTDR
ncbi:MAG: DMT family transporter [Ruminococcus sp.]|nr:DMT family transporter [Ruminococcus sp.]